MKKAISFRNGHGLWLRGFVIEPKKYDTAILFLHGFPGSCEGFSTSRLAAVMGKTRYFFMAFDFSHTNKSEGKFEDKLMSKEADDICYAIDFLQKNYRYKRLVLIGISTGAIDAALYAHRDKRIDKLVLLGGVSDLKHAARYDFTDEQVREFWRKGHITHHAPGKWYHGKKLKKAFYDEFFTLDIPRAIRRWKKPLLVVHGEKDEAVPLQDGEELFALANKPKKLAVIRGADHRFSKPWHFLKVLKVVDGFIRRRN